MNIALIDEAIVELRTIKDILRWGVSQLTRSNVYYGHGTDNPWDEMKQLVLAILALPDDLPDYFYDAALTKSERKKIITLLSRRINEHIPIAYLTNSAKFCGLDFYVDERVLIPRSPIAELIETGFSELTENKPNYLLDLCTGSGCIAIACAHYLPTSQVDAVDVSPDALAVAEYNIQLHNMDDRIALIRSDLFNQLPIVSYDVIVTNPPYVDEDDMAMLPAEYLHEPTLALEASWDGLALVRRILYQSVDYLADNGILICEVGNSYSHLIAQYPEVPFKWLNFARGGMGVFMLTKAQLIAYHAHFSS